MNARLRHLLALALDTIATGAKHPVPGPQTAPGAPQSPNPTTDTPGGQTGAQGRHPYEPSSEDE